MVLEHKTSKRSHVQRSSGGNHHKQPANNAPVSNRTRVASSSSSQVSNSSTSYRDRLVSGSQPSNLTPPRQVATSQASSLGVQNPQQANSSRGASQPRAKYASYIPSPIYHIMGFIFNILWGSHRAQTYHPVPEVQAGPSSINGTWDVSHGQEPMLFIGPADLERVRQSLKELDDQRELVRELQEELGMAKAQYESQCLAYEQLLREKEKLSEDQARLLAENQDYGQRVSRLAVVVENKKLYVGPQQSDNGISEQFEGLYRRVRDFSFSFLSEHQVPNALVVKGFRNMVWEFGLRTVEDYESLLAVKKTRRLMVQSIVGYYIRYFAFRRFPEESEHPRPTLDQCLSQRNSAAIDALERTLRQRKSEITQQELNDWRALTLTLVSRAESNIPGMNTLVEGERKQIKLALVESVMRRISEWAKPQEDRRRLRQELGVIFDAAFELSLLLRKQRALWFVRFPDVSDDGELRFDPTTMEDILSKQMDDEHADELQKGKTVSLVIFPALYKRGNTSGENYESEICVVKAQVKCIDSVPDSRTGYSSAAVTDHGVPENWTGHSSGSVTDHKLPDSWTGHAGDSIPDHKQPAMQHPPYPNV